jgi:Flp pilus assembly protein TadD
LNRATSQNGARQTGQPVLVHQLVMALGLVLTFIAYCGTLGFDFAYDDRSQVVGNPWIRSWRFAPRYFTVSVWGFHNPYVFGNYYRPLFFLWLRVNHMLFGLKPWGWHLTSVLAHLGVTVLVYYLASRILSDRLTAAIAATIFGVHPVHIESVAWVSGVPEPSLALLLISAFLCYLKSQERGRRSRAWLLTSVLLYCAAMFAKETALVFPLLLIAYEWIFSSDAAGTASLGSQVIRVRNALRCAVPYLVPVPVYLTIRAAVLKGFSHAVTPLPFSTLFFTWPSLLWFDIKLLAWPVGLSPCYDTPYITGPDLPGFFLPLAALVGVAIILWVWARGAPKDRFQASSTPKSRAIAFASVWILVPILPSFDLSVFLRGDVAHDRYMYLPSVGFALLVALALREIRPGPWKLYGHPAVQTVATLTLVVVLVLGTVFQSLMWADDLLLYSRGVKVCPSNRNVKMNLGIVACERGFYSAGIELFQEVIQEYPNFWIAYYNLGYTYYKLGNLEEADRYLTRATQVDLFAAHAYLYLGLTRMKMGRLNDAEALLRHAARAAPDGAPLYHFALGLVLKAQGDLKGALEEFKTELLVDPEEQAARDQIIEIEARLSSESQVTEFGRPARQKRANQCGLSYVACGGSSSMALSPSEIRT